MSSKLVTEGRRSKESRLVEAINGGLDLVRDYSIAPSGVWGSQAEVSSNGLTIKSSELDIAFEIPFDDDMEPNEAEIIIYNLSTKTANRFKQKKKITVKAGYKGDTGVVFSGYIDRITTKYEGADKATVIKALDDLSSKKINNVTFKKGRKASYILKYLLERTKTPIAVFRVRRDHTYKDSVTVDGDLMNNIKKYAEVCGISVFVKKGKIYARSLKIGDSLGFTVSESTGMIGSPMPFEETKTVEKFNDTIKGYDVDLLLQHRMSAGGTVKLKSMVGSGTYRIQSGKHIFNESEAITKIRIF